jgi:MFS family permease
LYSVYSFPNIVLPLVGGYLIDKFGVKFNVLLYGFLTLFGTFLVALGSNLRSFSLMIVGRFFFGNSNSFTKTPNDCFISLGMGAESSYVVQNNMCVDWFYGSKYLAFAMVFANRENFQKIFENQKKKKKGITIAISRLGTILSFNTEALTVTWFSSYHWGLWFSFFFCFFSFFFGIAYVIVDTLVTSSDSSSIEENQGLLIDSPEKELTTKKASLLKSTIENNTIRLSDLKSFTFRYWILVFIATTIYSVIFPFLSLASSFVVEKYSVSVERSNFYLSLIDICALISTPFFGILVDFTGKRGILVLFANSLAVLGLLLIAFTPSLFFFLFAVILLGVHFSMMRILSKIN